MYLWCALYLISLYALQMVVVLPVMWEGMPFSLGLFGGLTLLSLLLAAVGIGLAVVGLVRTRQEKICAPQLRRIGLIVKIVTIPFYLIHLASWAVVCAAFLVIPGLQIFLISGFFGVAFAYVVLLTGSAYTLSAIYLAWREGVLGMGGMIVGILSQLVPVVDLLAYVILLIWTAKRRRQKKEVG